MIIQERLNNPHGSMSEIARFLKVSKELVFDVVGEFVKNNNCIFYTHYQQIHQF